MKRILATFDIIKLMPTVCPTLDAFAEENMLTVDDKVLLQDFVQYADPLHYSTMALQFDISLSAVFPQLVSLWSVLRKLKLSQTSSVFLKTQAFALDQELNDIFVPLNENYILATYLDIRYKDMLFTDIISVGDCDKLLRKRLTGILTTVLKREENKKIEKPEENVGLEVKDYNINNAFEDNDFADEEMENNIKPVKKKAKISDSLIDYGGAFHDEMDRKREALRLEKVKEIEKEKIEAQHKTISLTDKVKYIVDEACNKWLPVDGVSKRTDPDGLQFWKQGGIKDHPILWEFVARGYLGAPGGNSSSERIFNITDMIMDKKRSGVKEKARNALIILHENAHLFPDKLINF